MTSSYRWRIETAKNASGQAYDRLKRAIIDGEFEAGERLTELGVAARLGVSRTPVREAFARLIKDGLVRNSRQGVEVVDPQQEFAEIHYIREVIEGCAARLAALRATPEEARDIADLAQAHAALSEGDAPGRAEIDGRFHLAVAAAAHAPRLARLVSDYRDLFGSPDRLKTYVRNDSEGLFDEHRAIARAIAEGDGDAAEAAMRSHLRAVCAAGRPAGTRGVESGAPLEDDPAGTATAGGTPP